MNRGIRAITVSILNNSKRAYNKTYFDFSASTREGFNVTDLMIKDIKLVENF